MRFHGLATATLLSLSLIIVDSRASWAFEPITDAMLDKADANAKDVIARAEAAGNTVAKAIGEEVLKAIAALREAIHSSIGDAKEAYIKSERNTYDNISKLLDQASDGEHTSMTDVTALLATVSDEVGNLPFVNEPPEVMLYQPHVMVPDGPSEIPLRVIGPKLAASDPSVTFGKSTLQVQKSRDVEIVALLDRKLMAFADREEKYVPVQLRYNKSQEIWWKPWTWFRNDVVERDMTLLLLPRVMGTYSIRTNLNSTDYQYKDIGRHAGGHGHDNIMDEPIRLDPPDVKDGWKMDVDKLRKNFKFWETSGDSGASCSGLLSSSLTPDGFTFRLVHGHKTDFFGHKSDVDVQCDMTVPLVKATPKIIDGPILTGDIGWSKDVRQSLPTNFASYAIALKLFNGKEYILDADTKVPFGLIEITQGKDFVQFRPRPPADF